MCDAQGRLRAHPKLSSLPCFLFFFFFCLFFSLFFSSRYSSIGSLSLSLVDAFAVESRRPSAVVSTISNNSVDELYSAREDRKIVKGVGDKGIIV